MKFRPILFSTPMIKAILNGTKTQTHRKIKPQPKYKSMNFQHFIGEWALFETPEGFKKPLMYHAKKKLNIGDVFWVRETFQKIDSYKTGNKEWIYKANGNYDDPTGYIEDWKGWKPSIFMPKKACRILLECTNVRVERLQDISESDSKTEGVLFYDCDITKQRLFKDYVTKEEGYGHPDCDYPSVRSAKESFETLWHSINGEESWNENPYCWIYDFKQVDKPDNFI